MDNITKRKILLTIIIAGIIALLILTVIETVNTAGNYLYFITLLAPILSLLFIRYYPDRKILGQGESSGGGLWDFFFGEGPSDPALKLVGTMPAYKTSEENTKHYKEEQDRIKRWNALTKDQKENYDGMYG